MTYHAELYGPCGTVWKDHVPTYEGAVTGLRDNLRRANYETALALIDRYDAVLVEFGEALTSGKGLLRSIVVPPSVAGGPYLAWAEEIDYRCTYCSRAEGPPEWSRTLTASQQ